jgi:hypothetical protein
VRVASTVQPIVTGTSRAADLYLGSWSAPRLSFAASSDVVCTGTLRGLVSAFDGWLVSSLSHNQRRVTRPRFHTVRAMDRVR